MTLDPKTFAVAMAERDLDRLGAAITETVRMRCLLPGGPIEDHGRADVLARFESWFEDMDTVELVDVRSEDVIDKLLIHYRLTLTQGATRWATTQTLVCKVDDDRLAVIDLLCSGMREF